MLRLSWLGYHENGEVGDFSLKDQQLVSYPWAKKNPPLGKLRRPLKKLHQHNRTKHLRITTQGKEKQFHLLASSHPLVNPAQCQKGTIWMERILQAGEGGVGGVTRFLSLSRYCRRNALVSLHQATSKPKMYRSSLEQGRRASATNIKHRMR